MAPLKACLAFLLLVCAPPARANPPAYENDAQKLTRLYIAERVLYMNPDQSEEDRAAHYAKALQLAKDADAAELKSGAVEPGSIVNSNAANLEEMRQIVLREQPPPPPADQKAPNPTIDDAFRNVTNALANQLDTLQKKTGTPPPGNAGGAKTAVPGDGSAPNGGLAQQIKNDPRAALGNIDQIALANPDDPRVFALRASVKSSLGDDEGAAADAKAALALDPKNQLAKLVAGYGAQAAASSARAGRLLKGGFETRGAPDLGGGAGKAGREGGAGAGGPSATSRKADAVQMTVISPFVRRLAAGRRCMRIGDAACAVDEATGVLASDPADRDALLLRASAFNRLGRPNEALADADSILAAKPEDVAALLERGYAKFQLGRFAEALADVETALRLEPLNAMGHLYRGMILEKLDRASDSIASFLRAMELDPALKPLADEALFRLRGGTGAPPAGGESRLPSNGRLALWSALSVIALGLLLKGLRRAANPSLHTPMTPLR